MNGWPVIAGQPIDKLHYAVMVDRMGDEKLGKFAVAIHQAGSGETYKLNTVRYHRNMESANADLESRKA